MRPHTGLTAESFNFLSQTEQEEIAVCLSQPPLINKLPALQPWLGRSSGTSWGPHYLIQRCCRERDRNTAQRGGGALHGGTRLTRTVWPRKTPKLANVTIWKLLEVQLELQRRVALYLCVPLISLPPPQPASEMLNFPTH